jgi:hypothetical protein
LRKRLALFAAVTALAMPFGGTALAAISEGPGKGNPDTNASGKCPGGQNKDTSPGGLKKCPYRLRDVGGNRGQACRPRFSLRISGVVCVRLRVLASTSAPLARRRAG